MWSASNAVNLDGAKKSTSISVCCCRATVSCAGWTLHRLPSVRVAGRGCPIVPAAARCVACPSRRRAPMPAAPASSRLRHGARSGPPPGMTSLSTGWCNSSNFGESLLSAKCWLGCCATGCCPSVVPGPISWRRCRCTRGANTVADSTRLSTWQAMFAATWACLRPRSRSGENARPLSNRG